MDYEEETEEEEMDESVTEKEKKIEDEKKVWTVGPGWKIDPRTQSLNAPYLLDPAIPVTHLFVPFVFILLALY